MYNYQMNKTKKATELELSGMRLQLKTAYEKLIGALGELGDAIETDTGFIWVARVPGDPITIMPRQTVVAVYSKLSSEELDDPKNTFTRYGLIGASPVVIELAKNVNKHKEALQAAVAEIRRNERDDALTAVYKEICRTPLLKDALRRFNISFLNIKQSTRKICILTEQPKRIGFTRARHVRVVEKLSYEDAHKLASDRDYINVVNKIEQLGPNAQFVRVRKQAPHVRANITYHDGVRIKDRKDQVPAPMPLMYPTNTNLGDPVHNGLASEVLFELSDTSVPRERRSRSSMEWYVDMDNPVSEHLRIYVKKRNI